MIERIVTGLMRTNTYLFSAWKKECILIDPGGDADIIIKHMNVKNLTPRGIICTHGHLDHIAAAGAVKDHFLGKGIMLKIAVHESDSHYFGDEAKTEHLKNMENLGPDAVNYVNQVFTPIPEADILLKDQDSVFDSDLKVYHTPGHTSGGICLYSESQSLLFSGDTLFFEGIGRTDLPDSDYERLILSLKESIYKLPESTRVFPGHGPYTSLEREIMNNPFTK